MQVVNHTPIASAWEGNFVPIAESFDSPIAVETAIPTNLDIQDWNSIKAYEPALAQLELEALAMRSYGNRWWIRSRVIIDKLRSLVGRDAVDSAMWTTVAYDTCERAIYRAFHKEVSV